MEPSEHGWQTDRGCAGLRVRQGTRVLVLLFSLGVMGVLLVLLLVLLGHGGDASTLQPDIEREAGGIGADGGVGEPRAAQDRPDTRGIPQPTGQPVEVIRVQHRPGQPGRRQQRPAGIPVEQRGVGSLRVAQVRLDALARIARRAKAKLAEMGVQALFGPGATTDEIVQFIRENVQP